MAALAVILEAIARISAVALGGWLAYTEVSGVHEYFMAEQGTFNYMVRAAVGITLASAILPHFLGKAIKQKRFGRASMVALGFFLSVAVVLWAGVHRTVHVADVEEASQKEAARKLNAAQANVQDAEKALVSNETLTATECGTGVGKECKKLAAGGKETRQTTIALRTTLAETKEPVKDSTPGTISALTGGRLSEQQVRTFQPLLLPVSVSFIAGLLITLGLDMEQSQTPNADRKLRRSLSRWWRKKTEALVVPPMPRRWRNWPWHKPQSSTSTLPRNVSDAEVIEMEPTPEPAPEAKPRVPDRPRPKLAAITKQPVGAVLDFLHDGLEIVAGPRTEMADAFIGYTAWCKAMSLRPMGVIEFVVEMETLCKKFGIRIHSEGDRGYLLNVRLVKSDKGSAAASRCPSSA